MFTSGVRGVYDSSVEDAGDKVSVVVDGDDDFCLGGGFSPNPLPPAERAHGDDGRWTIGVKCDVVNALASKGPAL